jgi:hypothetical protein
MKGIFHTHGNLVVQLLLSLDFNDLLLSESSLVLETDEFFSMVP